jgi:hypothetical protein
MKELSHDTKQSSWRFELKYRISAYEYHKIRIAILPFMRRDHFTQISPADGYMIRSLYYDTYDYRSYHEKMNGDHERIKFRMRTYSKDMTDNPFIRVEMKVRKGNAMEKHGVPVTADDYRFFMQQKHWPENSNPILHEFERYLHLWDLKPQILIQYYREGYEDREKDGIRITFDHKVCAAHSDTLFPDSHMFFRDFLPHTVILEIKCRHKHPAWLRDLIRNYGLRWVANSKFTQGLQAARKDLYHPGDIVIIR